MKYDNIMEPESSTRYIDTAQTILSQIEEKCKDVIDLESKLEMADYNDLKLSSADIVEYEKLTSRFLENLMYVDVDEVITRGFLCNFSECETTFFLGKKRVLALMTHILQDIILFRNFLKLTLYTEMFSAIVSRQLAINFIQNIRNDIKTAKTKIDNLSGLIRQIDSRGEGEMESGRIERLDRYEKELSRMRTRHDTLQYKVKVWEDKKSDAGKEASSVKSRISGKTDEEMFDLIVGEIPDDRERKEEMGTLLRKVIYLRYLDNLCNAILNRSNGMVESEVQKGVAQHQKWIEVLEKVSRVVSDSMIP